MKKNVSFFACFLLLCGCAHAGVVVGGTRIIYDGDKKESSISIENPDASPYLIQSWIEDEAGNHQTGYFVITPPLFRLDGKQKNTIRIIQTNAPLTAIRESLFWLNIKAIPAADPSGSANTLQLAINTRIKLIYRPGALKGIAPDSVSNRLEWSRAENSLTVFNPTPYYINFNSLYAGGNPVEKVTYVAPLASAHFTLPQGARSNLIEWKVISDYGAIGAVHKASF
ncbi:molecular chaperone [Erwinia tasmaniensis]|uniref:fimbrial biogenesis chaperone n=1 Tax=Erwinia tasmaniensis TaxID=338565 RepID=UPI003A4DD90F